MAPNPKLEETRHLEHQRPAAPTLVSAPFPVGMQVRFTLYLWGESHPLIGEVIEGLTNIATTTLEQWERQKDGNKGLGDSRWEVAQTAWQPEQTIVVKYRIPGEAEDRVVQLPVRSVQPV